ncbi:MFS transporter [Halalkalibacterium halodurans]|uniref:MFS transporter n=1 Tax=Halalkalibacterium halodurans TaxID=86665 RepID=UPI0010675C04|nr:MFS transporter [Halalkalibacterium halodurans]TES48932.1 MFS transporter [Halalkalibacterium halodurans]
MKGSLLLLSNGFEKLSSIFYTMIFTFYLYEATRSVTLSTLVTLVSLIAMTLGSFLVPVTSTLGKTTVILFIGQLTQAATVFIVSVFLFFGWEQQWGILSSVFVIGLLSGMIGPSKRAILPAITKEQQRLRMNSLFATVGEIISFLGWIAGGVLIAFFGNMLLLVICGFLLSVAAVLSLLINLDLRIGMNTSGLKGFFSGWINLIKHRDIRFLTVIDVLESIGSAVWIGGITLAFVVEILELGETWWGYINSAYFLGTIGGGVLIALLSRYVNQSKLTSLAIGSFGVGVLTLLYGLNTIPLLALILVILIGPFYVMRLTTEETIFQEVVPAGELEKTYAAKGNLSYVAFCLSILLMGFLADTFGPATVYFISGIGYVISSMLVFLYRRPSVFSGLPSSRTNKTKHT